MKLTQAANGEYVCELTQRDGQPLRLQGSLATLAAHLNTTPGALVANSTGLVTNVPPTPMYQHGQQPACAPLGDDEPMRPVVWNNSSEDERMVTQVRHGQYDPETESPDLSDDAPLLTPVMNFRRSDVQQGQAQGGQAARRGGVMHRGQKVNDCEDDASPLVSPAMF